MSGPRLLAGPDMRSGPESYLDHIRRLGTPNLGGKPLIEALAHSGLTGRGGASFPVGHKWKAVAAVSRGSAVVIANGAEGEPQSYKDRLLMATRPHLILDGAFLAARSLHAGQVVVYVGEEHQVAWAAMSRALSERPDAEKRTARMAGAPHRYVAGESSAAVHLVDAGVATPTTTPPHPRERGVAGAPTLVQNVETLAHIALIARYGAEWYRSAGRRGAAGTVMITIAGGVKTPGVLEVEAGTTVEEAVAMAGGVTEPAAAVLIGGYFGSWVPAASAWELPLDGAALRDRGLSLGCGVIGVQPAGRCGVCDTARIMRYLAQESSSQCGPCFFGLRALSESCSRVAERGANRDDLARLKRWAIEVHGRGACKHPDGAVTFLRSALSTFADEFASHPAHWRQQPA
ncbi:MAG TPA: NADH-ubiquinone oxidoreductase-F iron-sulfur binding region domain-containing protein [Candidatus Dormibacteraeota bacterium]|nr:NADH-ubiquinone oxidoreductase-F iron-sulfur binding region domain-containing protein [Candidatus Dormibacteraeota bacterium]